MDQNYLPQVQAPVNAGELPATADGDEANAPHQGVIAVDQRPFTYPARNTLARWLLVFAALYAVGWLTWQASPALIPFMIGLLLAYLLTPLVNRLNRRMPRWLAILIVYVVGIGAIAGAFRFLVPAVIEQIEQAITSIPSIDAIRAYGEGLLQQYQLRVPEVIRQPINDNVDTIISTVQSNLGSYAQQVGKFLANQVLQIINTITFLIGFLIIPIWLFYILNDQDEGKAFINKMLHPRLRPDFWNVWSIINRVFSDYIRGQLLLGLAVGSMVGVGLLLLRLIGFEIKYILLLSIIAAITELIPIIGPIIGAIPAIIIGIVASQDPVSTGLAVTALYVVVQQLENNLLVPRIVGTSVGVHPAILTVVLIAMGQVFGLLGVILSAPLSAIARDLFLYIYRRLSNQSPETTIRSITPQSDTTARSSQPSGA